MIFDTLALKAQIASEKRLDQITSHDVFTVLMDLKDRGMLNFDYELLTDGNGNKFNAPSHQLKHMIREICRRVLGMTTVGDDMVREVEIRLKYYLDNAVVVAETEEFTSGVDNDPTVFITLSMASSAAFDAAAPYRVMGMTWTAGENGVAKLLNPTYFDSYSTGVVNARIWTASFSPGAASSIFNNLEFEVIEFGEYKFKMMHVEQWTNQSLCDLMVGVFDYDGIRLTVENQATSTVATDFAPKGADLTSQWMVMDRLFGHINLSSGLVISWSKGGGDWD